MGCAAPLTRFTEAPPVVVAFWPLALSLPLIALTLTVRAESGALRLLSQRELLVAASAGVFLAAHFVTWIASVTLTSVAAAVALWRRS